MDIGHRFESELNNFDHHQFDRELEPTCALSLVLQNMGIYEDSKEFCGWLETTEWFDCRGPNETAEWLGVEREALAKLNLLIRPCFRLFQSIRTSFRGTDLGDDENDRC